MTPVAPLPAGDDPAGAPAVEAPTELPAEPPPPAEEMPEGGADVVNDDDSVKATRRLRSRDNPDFLGDEGPFPGEDGAPIPSPTYEGSADVEPAPVTPSDVPSAPAQLATTTTTATAAALESAGNDGDAKRAVAYALGRVKYLEAALAAQRPARAAEVHAAAQRFRAGMRRVVQCADLREFYPGGVGRVSKSVSYTAKRVREYLTLAFDRFAPALPVEVLRAGINETELALATIEALAEDVEELLPPPDPQTGIAGA